MTDNQQSIEHTAASTVSASSTAARKNSAANNRYSCKANWNNILAIDFQTIFRTKITSFDSQFVIACSNRRNAFDSEKQNKKLKKKQVWKIKGKCISNRNHNDLHKRRNETYSSNRWSNFKKQKWNRNRKKKRKKIEIRVLEQVEQKRWHSHQRPNVTQSNTTLHIINTNEQSKSIHQYRIERFLRNKCVCLNLWEEWEEIWSYHKDRRFESSSGVFVLLQLGIILGITSDIDSFAAVTRSFF